MKTLNLKDNQGGGIMKKLFRWINRESKGFTLVELLIVIAILGVLAAVVLPNVTGLTGEGETEAAKAELVTLQTAMDTMMAKNSLTSVTATAATANMSAFPTGSALYPSYLRTATTKGTYSCSTSGLVTQVTTGYE
jgi:prepilin-type N-terminal cleavage/methylation domain-containing protein